MENGKYAVIGHPIGHTMSPFIHRRLFSLCNKTVSYSVLDVINLEDEINRLKELDGFNITIPYKTDIIPFLSGISESAKISKSVNTVTVENGKLFGNSTDAVGCKKALERHGLSLGGRVLLLGNGGAARALAFEIAASSVPFEMTIACRNSSRGKAEALKKEIDSISQTKNGIQIFSYEELEREEKEYDLLVNATSVGMTPNTKWSPVSEKVVIRAKAVFDAVYNPQETKLLSIAKKCEVKTVGGMEMLVYQAVRAHEIWYNAAFNSVDLEVLCQDANDEMNRLFNGQGG